MSSRKEQKEALRQERLAREQAEAQAAARKRLIGIVIAAILVLGIVGALVAVVLAGGDDDDGVASGGGDTASVSYPDGGEIPAQKTASLDEAIKATGCKEQVLSGVEGSGEHTTGEVEYQSEPPAIGSHYPEWPEDDIYEEAPPLTRVVHLLEHGRILIWVRPDASQDLLGQVKALYEEDPYHVVVIPRAEIEEPIAVSAWVGQDSGHILRCPNPDDNTWDAIRAFKEKYRDKAPEFVP